MLEPGDVCWLYIYDFYDQISNFNFDFYNIGLLSLQNKEFAN